MNKPQIHALEALSSLLGSELDLHKLDETHDLLRLLGIVIGQIALLETVTSKTADSRAKVAAAKILTSTKESPESIAQRLRRSPFADLTVDQLRDIVKRVGNEDLDLQRVLEAVKAGDGHDASQDSADGVGAGEGNAVAGRDQDGPDGPVEHLRNERR